MHFIRVPIISLYSYLPFFFLLMFFKKAGITVEYNYFPYVSINYDTGK